MKRMLAIMCTLLLICFCLTGCVEEQKPQTNAKIGENESVTTVETTMPTSEETTTMETASTTKATESKTETPNTTKATTTTKETTTAKTTTTTKATTTTKITTTTKATTTTQIVTTQAPVTEGVMVWIPQSGSKYHSHSGCSNMKNPSQVTKSRAEEIGYTPCKKCY